VRGGVWLEDDAVLGVEASYLLLSSRAVGRAVAGAETTPIVARPFFDVVNNRQDSSLDVFPGLLNGRAEASATSFFDGADLSALWTVFHGEHWHVMALAGVRYLNLGEDVRIEERVQVSPASPRFGGSAMRITAVSASQDG